MNKIKSYLATSYGRASSVTAIVMASLGIIGIASAQIDPNVQAVASTTGNYLNTQFVATLEYILPIMLLTFVVFWAVRFVWRKIKAQAH